SHDLVHSSRATSGDSVVVERVPAAPDTQDWIDLLHCFVEDFKDNRVRIGEPWDPCGEAAVPQQEAKNSRLGLGELVRPGGFWEPPNGCYTITSLESPQGPPSTVGVQEVIWGESNRSPAPEVKQLNAGPASKNPGLLSNDCLCLFV